MKSFFLSLILVPGFVTAQRWHINVTGGASNYTGDLQDKNYTFDQSFFAFGAVVQYDITRNFSAVSNISIMKIGASDAFNSPDVVFRNLSFQSNIIEWNLIGRIHVYGYYPQCIFSISLWRNCRFPSRSLCL